MHAIITMRRRRRLPPGYLTVSEAAENGPLSRGAIYRDIKTGHLPVGRWRGRIVLDERDLEARLAVLKDDAIAETVNK